MRDNMNLTPERGPNVWDKKHTDKSGDRWKSEVGGAVMIAAGAAAALVGGRMIYRALRQGHIGQVTAHSGAIDLVNQESAQSFPASDAPSWTSSGVK